MPDVPLSAESPLPSSGGARSSIDPMVENAKFRMADEMEHGRTPYDFSGEMKTRRKKPGGFSSGSGFSTGSIIGAAAFLLVAMVVFLGWKLVSGVTGKIDAMNQNVTELTGRLNSEREAYKAAEKALVRSELRKTLVALDSAIAMGDPVVTPRALKLRDEVKDMLVTLGGVQERQPAAGSIAVSPYAAPAKAPAAKPYKPAAPAESAGEAAPQDAQPAPVSPEQSAAPSPAEQN
ncbi:MAG: hypothetical protein HY751_12900 [Nitrospinae bacterium]|nr:hypothetical protein [Nitrospinota bacterium]